MASSEVTILILGAIATLLALGTTASAVFTGAKLGYPRRVGKHERDLDRRSRPAILRFPHRVLLYLAGSDRSILARCPRVEFYLQTILGMAVLLTAIMAGLAGGYAMSLVFDDPGIYMPFGVLWGLIIMNIDRQLITTTSVGLSSIAEVRFFRRLVVPVATRLPIAVVLGLVIAIPLELRMFAREIDRKLMEDKEHRRIELLNSAEASRTKTEAKRAQCVVGHVAARAEEVQDAKAEVQRLEELIAAGNDIVSRDGRVLAPSSFWELRRQLREATARRNNLQLKYPTELANAETKCQTEVDPVVETPPAETGPIAGLVTRYETLSWLHAANPAAREIGLGIRLVIILIEVMPVLVKVLGGEKAYDRLVEHALQDAVRKDGHG